MTNIGHITACAPQDRQQRRSARGAAKSAGVNGIGQTSLGNACVSECVSTCVSLPYKNIGVYCLLNAVSEMDVYLVPGGAI